MVVKNNIREEKIKEQIQEIYKDMKPSVALRQKIKQSYEQNQKKDNSIIINLLQMIRSYKFALVVGTIAIVLLVGGTAMYFQEGRGGRSLSLKEIDKILPNEELDSETEEITNDLNENLDDLDLLAQSESISSDIISQGDTNLDEIGLDDLTETLDGLDEINGILNEDVFGDDLFL